jgi:hypothetical protein
MKHIKNYKLFEASIPPLDFTEFLNGLKTMEFNNLEDLNDFSMKFDINFSNFDDFYDSLELDIEKELAPKELMLMGGVKFALFNKYENCIMIVVEEEMFIDYLKNRNLDQLIAFLNEVLRHESIHLQQVDRMKDKSIYKLDSSPTHNAMKYWKEKRELMAYAQSLIDQLTQQGLTKSEIGEKIRTQKDIKSWIWNVYSKVLSVDEMKRFLKYVYQYWEMIK